MTRFKNGGWVLLMAIGLGGGSPAGRADLPVIDRPAPGGGDEPARLTKIIYPVYPYSAAVRQKPGKARVAIVVDTAGLPAAVTVEQASEPAFGLALAAAAWSYRFTPGFHDGKPALTKTASDFEFVPRAMLDDTSSYLLELEKRHPDQIHSPRELDRPLIPLARAVPIPPREVRSARTSLVTFLIDEDGHAQLPRVERPDPDLYDGTAIQAVARWVFEPATVHHRRAVVRVAVPIEFGEIKAATTP